MVELEKKRYLIVTYWGYPFGGGEAFMYQTMKWATRDGRMNTYWLCFCGADNKPFPQFSCEEHEFGTLIKVPGAFSPKNLNRWLRLLQPDIVHHQGHRRIEILKECMKLKIPFVSGFHFWHGGVELTEPWSNHLIVENAQHHKKHPELDFVMQNAQNVYLASEYMQEVFSLVCKVDIPFVVHPISDKAQVSYVHNNPITSRYILQVNIHKHKGGKLFLELARRMQGYPFMAVRTELFSEDLDALIKGELVKEHEEQPCVYMERVEDVKTLYREAKVVLVPSLCDETFCRVALEAMMNGIPVLTTGRGNIKNIVAIPECILPLDDENDDDENDDDDEKDEKNEKDEKEKKIKWSENNEKNIQVWQDTITRLMTDDAFYRYMVAKTRKQADTFREEIVSKRFTNLLESTLEKSFRRNVMIMVPWCDQGLGIQGREYMNLLESLGFTVFIFSFLPYWNVKEKDRHQKNPEEWAHPRVYYSDYTREDVKDYEIIDYVKANNIGTAIIPETCWPRIFQVAHLLKTLNVKTFAVPNIEIVRRDEMHLHRHFDVILCNNYICKRTFEDHGFTNCFYIGYSLPRLSSSLCLPPTGKEQKEKEKETQKKKKRDDIFVQADAHIEKNNPGDKKRTLRFMCLGGMNSFTRKQVVEVCQAFDLASRALARTKKSKEEILEKKEGNEEEKGEKEEEEIEKEEEGVYIHLVVCIQGKYDDRMDAFLDHPNIFVVRTHLAYSTILDMYDECDINIQVSKHEGLGLGFFESLSHGTPCLTLDTAPHNEIISHEKTGWIIPCTFKPMLDNNCGFMESAYFVVQDLADQLCYIALHPKETRKISENTLSQFNTLFNHHEYKSRWLQILL